MIWTGYFSGYKGDNGVAICLYKPYWFQGEQYLPLAPTKRLLYWFRETNKGKDAQEIYCRLYKKYVLSKLDVHQVARALDGKVLLCYEKPGVFCHRHIVAEWLNENGYECKEI
ncbi:MAG: DUF488 family protein [Bacilli bacterium]|nr:DUF488 family protein [Bacilli bacterium]